MSRWWPAAVLAVLAPICVVGLTPRHARGEEPTADARGKDAKATEALGLIMKALFANKGSVRVGMTVANADRASAGAAKHLDQRYLPLRGSWLDKGGRMNGVVDWDVDLEAGTKVDSIRVVLLTERFDRKEVGKAVVSVGREIGLKMAPDEEDKDTWFDAEAEGVELWVTVGDGIIVVEAEVLAD